MSGIIFPRKFLVFFLFVLGLFISQSVLAGTEHNISGFAWSDSVGWISFNCTDADCAYNYGVNIDPATGLFSGYAWSENLGWISFNSTDLAGCPDGNCAAKINAQNKEISGWAKIISNNGWMKLRGADNQGNAYGLFWNNTTQELEGFAWSSDDLGWLSFNCKNLGEDCNVSYKIKALLDVAAPTISITGAPANWTNSSGITAQINCDDGANWHKSGCDSSSVKILTYSSSGSCSTNYSNYNDLSQDYTIPSHLWLCAAQKDNAGNIGFTSNRVEFKVDRMIPISSITSAPANQTWLSDGFSMTVNDKDYGGPNDPGTGGGTTLDLSACKYIVDLPGTANDSIRSRTCNSSMQITLKAGDCPVQGSRGSFTCAIHVYSIDHVKNESAEGVKTYGVDWTPPTVSKVYVNNPEEGVPTVKEGLPIIFKTKVIDGQSGIAGCNLFMKKSDQINYTNMGVMNINSSCYDCESSKELVFSDYGRFILKTICQDQPGNETEGSLSYIDVSENHSPTIVEGPSYSLTNCASPTTQDNCSVNFTVLASDIDADSLSYTWNFGDEQQAIGREVSHKYAQARTYNVQATVSDGRGGTDVGLISLQVENPALDVNLTADPNMGVAPLNNVNLTANVSGSMTGNINYKFDCTNDGTWDLQADDQANESYSSICNYSGAGNYTAKVMAERGSGSAQDTVNIVVSANQPPQAKIECSNISCTTYMGESGFALFNRSADPNGVNDIVKSEWDILGWGYSPDSLPCALCDFTPQTAFFGSGNYTIRLRVEDKSGFYSAAEKDFTIKQDIIADFICSTDNADWKSCSEVRPIKGTMVYFKDQSVKSEGSRDITSRIWKKDNVVFSQGNNLTSSSRIEGTIIELTVTDDAGRTDSQSYEIQSQLSIPQWEEISPF